MAEILAGELTAFGIQKLWDLLSRECERFQGVEDQITGLQSDLKWLSSFIKDADAKKHTSERVKTCVEEINEMICDGEDIIETFLFKQNLGKKTSGIKMRIRRLACSIPDRRENSLDIAGIRTKISDVIDKMQKFGVQEIITDGGYMQPLCERQRAMRQTFPTDDYESNFVGLEANVKELIGYLVEENDVQVVSVTGMGGLGKTTLARQVFNHEKVQRIYYGLAWVCVSQDFTQKNVWQKILVALKPKEEENKILQMTESTLQRELFRLLETSKSLIVLDDIWKEGDWDLIKPIFPPTKGWKVLLTSRNENIAMRRNTTYINLKLKCLTTEDTWTLFQKIALPKRDASELEIDEKMEKMGKQMVEHCGGLPLAIKVLGGLLAAKYTLHDWERLSENIGSHILRGRSDSDEDNNNSVKYVLSLSFEELPSNLKLCFLYLAHFPEDYNIQLEKLYYYWAAEGIYERRLYDGETIQDVGDYYIEELVTRNMVISKREATTVRFETCHLHDMMREICLFKAKEENFLQITSTRTPSTANFQFPVTSRRLVCQYPTTLQVDRYINNPKLRSLMVVQGNDYFVGGWELSGLSYARLELLRVLDLYKAKLEKWELPSGIAKLILLRYLSLEDAEVSHLPNTLGNLKLLIYLNISVNVEYISVPNVLMGMQELRYLALPAYLKRKIELRNLVNLETLENFSTKNCSLEDLRGMVKLRTLTIQLAEETSMETVSASIGGLRYLEKLRITFHGRIEGDVELDFVNLKELKLSMQMTRLPKEQHFPSRLTTLHLSSCRLVEDPMPILEKLLQLKEVYLWNNVFIGKRMVCSGGGFPKLQNLDLQGLDDLEEWIVEEGSMPLLHTLLILGCPKLKQLPDGLRFIYSLKDLIMDEKWKKILSEGGADYEKLKHIPSVYYC